MTDQPTRVAFDPAAPPDERYDANAELQALYKPLASELIPPQSVRAVIDHINADLEQQEQLVKARSAVVIPFYPDEKTRRGKGQAMQSVYVDKYQIFAHGEFFEKPSPMGFESLRTMSEQTPILAAIIGTRVRQIARFCGASEDGGEGFAIRHIDRQHQIQTDEQISINLIQAFFRHCGWEFNPRQRRRLRRDHFPAFMGKLIRDTLSMDAAAIETVYKRDPKQGIDGLHAVDGATIRLCTEEGYQGDDDFFAVQVIQGQIRTAYTLNDLIYEPRNPRTDVRLAGYGMGETELLVRIVTGFLNALTLNIKGFSDNSIPRGILQLCGDYDDADLSAFKRYWNGMVRGVNNAWALPVMVSKDKDSRAELTPINASFDEMYFSKWMTFLTSIACAIYSMSPDEINFESFSAQRSSLSGNDTEEKLANSKDKGLCPLMSYFEGLLTDFIVADFDDKYVFRWTGLEGNDKEKEWEAKKLILTWNELRAENGYDAIKPGKDGMPIGEAPLNPSLMGAWMQAHAPQPPQEDFDGGHSPFGDEDEKGEEGQQNAQDDQQNNAPGEASRRPTENRQEAAAGGQQPAGLRKALTIYTI